MKRSSACESSSSSKQPRLHDGRHAISSLSDPLCEWLAVNHVGMNGISFAQSTLGSLGCFADKRFEVGDLMFTVPKQCLFGIENVEGSGLARFLVQEAEALGQAERCTAELLLWISMILAKHTPSALHYACMNSLDACSPSLLSWPSDLLGALRGSNLGSSLHTLSCSLEQKAALLQAIYSRCPAAAQAQGLTEGMCSADELRWAAGHYLSRRYPGKYQQPSSSSSSSSSLLLQHREAGIGNMGVLVPLLDILNHNDQQDWLSLQLSAEGLQVICKYPRDKGEELFSNYGQLGSEQLLFAFGFALPANAHDDFALQLRGSDRVFRIGLDGSIPAELWDMLRLTLRELDGGFPTEVDGDERYHHPDMVDCLLSYAEATMAKMKSCYPAARDALRAYGVSYAATFPKKAKGKHTAECTAAGDDADARALQIGWYLAGQHRIVSTLLKELNQALQYALQFAEEENSDEQDASDDQ